jgi:osmoprotectant transport system substrate-binding protein
MKRVIAGVATALAATLAVSACGSSDPLAEDKPSGSASAGSITIGSANFPESQLLAEIYAQTLEAKGVTVTRKFDLGSREKYMDGLKDGSIDLIPEYTGTLLQFLNKQAKEVEADEVYTALQKELPSNLTVLDKAEAEDKDAIVVTKETADKWKLKSIEDLVPHCGEVTFGGPPEIQTASRASRRPTTARSRASAHWSRARSRRRRCWTARFRPRTSSPPTRPSRPTTWSCWRTRRATSRPRTSCR